VRGGASVAPFPQRAAPYVNLILHSVAEKGVRGGASVAVFLSRGAPCNSQSVAERGVRGGASVAAFLPRGAPCVTAWCAACWPGARDAATAVTFITCAPGAAAAGAPTALPAAAISASTAEIRILPPLLGGRVGADLEPSQAQWENLHSSYVPYRYLELVCRSALLSMRIRIQLLSECGCGSGCREPNADPCGSGSWLDFLS
jgi:hypothetical protein